MKDEKRAIVFLGGFLVEDGGKWVGSDFPPEFQSSGRVDFRTPAVLQLASLDNESTVVVSGGRGVMDDVIPDNMTIALAIKNDLVRSGVLENRIVLDNESHNTYAQLVKIAEKYLPNFDNMKVVSNDWHLPRIYAMIKYMETLRTLETGKIELISAENILEKHDPQKWTSIIEEVRKSDFMKEVIRREKEGAKAMEEGRYIFKKSKSK